MPDTSFPGRNGTRPGEQNAERYRVLFEHTAVGIALADLEGNLTEANPAFERMTGYPAEELQQMRYADFTHPEDAAAEGVLLQELLSGQRGSYEMEKRYIRKDARAIWVHLTVTMVRDEEGRPVAPLATVQDITERKEAEARLAESERRREAELDALVQGIPGAVFIGDENGVTRGNRYGLDLLGYASVAEMPKNIGWAMEEVAARDARTLVPIPYEEGIFFKALNGEVATRDAIITNRTTGASHVIRAAAAPVSLDRETFAAVVIAMDVSERVRVEEEVSQSESRYRALFEIADIAILEEDFSGVKAALDGLEAEGVENLERYFDEHPEFVAHAAGLVRINNVNEAGLRMFGAKTRAEFVTLLDRIFVPETLDAFRQELVAVVRGAERMTAGTVLRTLGGEQLDVLFSMSLPAVTGSFGRVIVTLVNITERVEAERTVRFLAEASLVLAGSLDYETTLQTVARLAVPEYADWCTISLLDEDGQLQQVAVQHVDPNKVAWARDLGKRYPTRMDSPGGAPNVVRTGKSELYPIIPEETLKAIAIDEEHLRIITSLGMKSAIIAPLTARGRTLGVLTLIITDADQRFSERDLPAVEELARTCALAVDNARLYGEAQREIEERRRAEEQVARLNQDLRQRLEEFRTMLDVSPVGFAVALDPQVQHVRVNPALAEMLGMGAEVNASLSHPEGVALPYRAYKDGRELKPEELPLERAINARVTISGEAYEVRRADGRRLSVLGYASPLFGEGGEVRGGIGAFVDVTEMKAAEVELTQLNETLEERVARRTAEMEAANESLQTEVAERRRTEAVLERTNTTLLTRNRELQDFAYVASHDLQEPLRKINTFAELLAAEYESALGEQGRMYLERMQSAAQRMSSLIHDLLQFSRITTKGQPFRKVNLKQIVAEVLSDLEVRVEEVKGTVEVSDMPEIEADPLQMRQLFQNLIGNALKFHRPEVPPVVRVSAQVEEYPHARTASGRRLCRLDVQDNGIGFDEKYLDRIFSPFQRLHTRSEYEGTGMGLAICRRIVERHHGTLSARSARDEGSTFTVFLPVEQERTAEAVAETVA